MKKMCLALFPARHSTIQPVPKVLLLPWWSVVLTPSIFIAYIWVYYSNRIIEHERECDIVWYQHWCDSVVGTRLQAQYCRQSQQCWYPTISHNLECSIAFMQQVNNTTLVKMSVYYSHFHNKIVRCQVCSVRLRREMTDRFFRIRPSKRTRPTQNNMNSDKISEHVSWNILNFFEWRWIKGRNYLLHKNLYHCLPITTSVFVA